MKKYLALFHLDEGNNFRGKLVIDNIINLLNDLEKNNVDVELVVNSGDIKLFHKMSSPKKEQVENLVKHGAHVVICRNSMSHFEFTEKDLLDVVDFSSSGVGELARKQAQGWAYFRL